MTPIRRSTPEPLVEQEVGTGTFFPTGRQFNAELRADGRNSYGLDDAENVAYFFAHARVLGTPGLTAATYETVEEGSAMFAHGITSVSSPEERIAFLTQYRLEHPLPTSFAPLERGDPCVFVEPIASVVAETMDALETEAKRALVAPGVTLPSTPAAIAAVPATTPATHVTASVLIEAIELAEAHPEAVTRLLSFVRNLFHHAA